MKVAFTPSMVVENYESGIPQEVANALFELVNLHDEEMEGGRSRSMSDVILPSKLRLHEGKHRTGSLPNSQRLSVTSEGTWSTESDDEFDVHVEKRQHLEAKRDYLRHEVISKILAGEEQYVRDMELVKEVYLEPLQLEKIISNQSIQGYVGA